MLPAALLLLAGLPALAANLHGRLVPNFVLNFTNLPLDSRVDLDYGSGSSLFRSDGSFQISGVKPGKHVVRPLIPGYAIPSLLVTLPEAENETVHVQSYFIDRLPLDTDSPSLPYPLEFEGLGEYNYYSDPPGMNVIQMFKSPMMLMMLFSTVMAIFLPKLTSIIETDPEMSKELRDQQKKMRQMQNMDWSGSLSGKLAAGAAGNDGESASPAGSGTGTPAIAAPAPTQRASTPSRGGQGKRGGKRK